MTYHKSGCLVFTVFTVRSFYWRACVPLARHVRLKTPILTYGTLQDAERKVDAIQGL